MKPELEIHLHLPGGPCTPDNRLLAKWLHASRAALADILNLPHGPQHTLTSLHTIEISIVDDPTIIRLHDQYLNDPSPTDVITFPHGDGIAEIIISSDTAERQAKAASEPCDRETYRYIVHGLLHLHGYTDHTDQQRAAMFALQEPLVARHWSP